jgi:hypothetical protein
MDGERKTPCELHQETVEAPCELHQELLSQQMDGYNNSIWSFIVFLFKKTKKNLKPQISLRFSLAIFRKFSEAWFFSQMLEGGWINTRSIEVCY